MKKTVIGDIKFARIFLSGLLAIFCCLQAYAQPSSDQSGFFPDDDQVFFARDVSGYDSVHLAINCDDVEDPNCWISYNGESILLANRSLQPNGWANGPFTRNLPQWFTDWIDVDESQPRNNLNKVNVLRLTSYLNGVAGSEIIHLGVGIDQPTNTADGAITFVDYDRLTDMIGAEGHYGPGNGYSALDSFVLIDTTIMVSTELSENYLVTNSIDRSFAEKPVVVSIYDVNMELIMQDYLGISISAGASVYLPNRGQKITAREEYSGDNRMEAALYGTSEEFKQIRLRSGGTSQMDNPCSYIGDPIGLDVAGYVRNRFNVLYMNGFFWSIGFIQEATKKHWAEQQFGYDRDQVDIVEADQPEGIKCESFSQLLSLADSLGINNGLGEGFFGEFATTPDDYCICGKVIEGDGRSFGRFAKSVVEDGELIRLDHQSLWDHVIYNAFFQNTDHITNNTYFICDDRDDPSWIVFGKDYDKAFAFDAKLNSGEWIQLIDTGRVDLFSRVARIALAPDTVKLNFIRRAQDLLNTSLLPANTIPQAHTRVSEIATSYDQQYDAWFPNVSFAPLDWNSSCTEEAMTEYMNSKPDLIKQTLAEDFLGGLNYTPNDQNTVSVNLDSVQELCGGRARIHLNSLMLEESWSGKYWPIPSVRIRLEIPPGYLFLGWVEFPGSTSMELEIWPDTDFSLTPLIAEAQSFCEGTEMLVINEIFPKGTGPDWIEIYNPTSEAISLVGLSLSDRANELDKYIIPQEAGAVIQGLGYAVLYADDGVVDGWDHITFKLNGTDGESIWLSDNGTVIDGFEFGPHPDNTSYGRCNDALEYMDSITMGAINVCDLPTGIQEWSKDDDWIYYPNPVRDYLILEMDFPERKDYRITNQIGQVVLMGRTSGSITEKIDLHTLPAGIYIIQMEDRTGKLLKQ